MSNQKLLDIQNAISLLHSEGYEVKEPVKPEIKVWNIVPCFDGAPNSYKYQLDVSVEIPKENLSALQSVIEGWLKEETPEDRWQQILPQLKEWEIFGEQIQLHIETVKRIATIEEMFKKAKSDSLKAGQFELAALIRDLELKIIHEKRI